MTTPRRLASPVRISFRDLRVGDVVRHDAGGEWESSIGQEFAISAVRSHEAVALRNVDADSSKWHYDNSHALWPWSLVATVDGRPIPNATYAHTPTPIRTSTVEPITHTEEIPDGMYDPRAVERYTTRGVDAYFDRAVADAESRLDSWVKRNRRAWPLGSKLAFHVVCTGSRDVMRRGKPPESRPVFAVAAQWVDDPTACCTTTR